MENKHGSPLTQPKCTNPIKSAGTCTHRSKKLLLSCLRICKSSPYEELFFITESVIVSGPIIMCKYKEGHNPSGTWKEPNEMCAMNYISFGEKKIKMLSTIGGKTLKIQMMKNAPAMTQLPHIYVIVVFAMLSLNVVIL